MEKYLELVEKVRKINPDAAEYLLLAASSKRIRNEICLETDYDTLRESFLWVCTPQGSKFWADIQYELDKMCVSEDE